jgi:hypothetical protein
MLIKGITQINQVLNPDEVEFARKIVIAKYETGQLKKEDFDNHYDNSYGGGIQELDYLYDRLTPVIQQMTGLTLKKANTYARVYLEGGTLEPHTDREGLDLTLSIQLENTFSSHKRIYAKGYDNTQYQSDLENGDSVLIKGRELTHWRERIKTTDPEGSRLTCVFVHWTIVRVQAEQVKNFVSAEKCKELIDKAESIGFQDSQVLQENKATLDYSSRSSKCCSFPIPELEDELRKIIGYMKFEGFQMLKYEKGNSFKPHYDNGNGVTKRLMTIIIYLNEEYKGGQTKFTNDGLVVTGETGKLLLWKNTNVGAIDHFSMHEGAEVESGIKYVLVNWVLTE